MPQAAIFRPLFFGQQINAGRSCHSRAAAFDDTSVRAIAAFAFWQSLVAPDFLLIGLSHKGHKGHKDNQFKNGQWHNSREGCPRRARSFMRLAPPDCCHVHFANFADFAR